MSGLPLLALIVAAGCTVFVVGSIVATPIRDVPKSNDNAPT